MDTTKILIADDHAIVRMGLASLLNTQDGLEVVGDAEDGEDAIRKTLELQPDVVIMDLMMPKKDGYQVLKEMREKGIETPEELMTEEKLAIVLGTEGDGLAKSTIADCDYTVKIPMANGVDSLNVAAASAVAFWQLGNR